MADQWHFNWGLRAINVFPPNVTCMRRALRTDCLGLAPALVCNSSNEVIKNLDFVVSLTHHSNWSTLCCSKFKSRFVEVVVKRFTPCTSDEPVFGSNLIELCEKEQTKVPTFVTRVILAVEARGKYLLHYASSFVALEDSPFSKCLRRSWNHRSVSQEREWRRNSEAPQSSKSQ